ncbi:hypothetical protein PCO82_05020 [Pectobacteriaceae bacterium CE90]|nr:hypothetical protein [Prodigiosinella sp. LS101]WJV52920.1 hypothetical protein PCO85_17210 [Prodigiosinella sp. LS101]WJV57275.1 hypothetical protein PCO84_17190 [Pectobacteriaceae bacterium C111]WJY14508.1 hypothetical protein PCO82_18785 [Pectobacteriaceae bacterium CE90]WJY16046.1 hypothetical protein PCO82_05020 [Pectobacteriaceae bacterium CE90]
MSHDEKVISLLNSLIRELNTIPHPQEKNPNAKNIRDLHQEALEKIREKFPDARYDSFVEIF